MFTLLLNNPMYKLELKNVVIMSMYHTADLYEGSNTVFIKLRYNTIRQTFTPLVNGTAGKSISISWNHATGTAVYWILEPIFIKILLANLA